MNTRLLIAAFLAIPVAVFGQGRALTVNNATVISSALQTNFFAANSNLLNASVAPTGATPTNAVIVDPAGLITSPATFWPANSNGLNGSINWSNAISTVPADKFLIVDPTNGSDVTGTRGRLDKPFASLAAAQALAQSGDVVRLSPGTHNVAATIVVSNGVSYIGSGINSTTVRLTNAPGPGSTGFWLFDGQQDGLADKRVADMTVDCNATNLSLSPVNMLGSVMLRGHRSAVERVRSVGCKNMGTGVEGFPIGVSQGLGMLIRGCIVDNYAGGQATMILMGGPCSGLVEGNWIDGTTPGTSPYLNGIGFGAPNGIIIANNIATNVGYGVYMDTGGGNDVVISGNVLYPTNAATGAGVGVYIKASNLILTNVLISANTITIRSEGGYGVLLSSDTGGAIRDAFIANNLIAKTVGLTTVYPIDIADVGIINAAILGNSMPSGGTIWDLGTGTKKMGSEIVDGTLIDPIVSGNLTLGGVPRNSWPSGGGTNLSVIYLNGVEIDGPQITNSSSIAWGNLDTNIWATVSSNSVIQVGSLLIRTNVLWASDGAGTVGAVSSGRPSAVYATTLIESGGHVGAGASSALQFSGRSQIKSAADGRLNVADSAGTAFTRMTLGPESASYPALKTTTGASGIGLQVRTGDDANYGSLAASNLTASVGFMWGTTNLGGAVALKQDQNTNLLALAGLTTAANRLGYFTGPGTMTATDLSAFGRSIIDDADASTARTTLGLAIDTDVQAHDADLDVFAALVGGADKMPYYTGVSAMATTTLTAFGRSVIDDANAAAARTTLGVAIDTDVQAHDADLDVFSALVGGADKMPYYTGVSAMATTDLSSFARTLIDDTTAAAARVTLGAGSTNMDYFTANSGRITNSLIVDGTMTIAELDTSLLVVTNNITGSNVTATVGLFGDALKVTNLATLGPIFSNGTNVFTGLSNTFSGPVYIGTTNIAGSIAGKATSATTLAGYGITDAAPSASPTFTGLSTFNGGIYSTVTNVFTGASNTFTGDLYVGTTNVALELASKGTAGETAGTVHSGGSLIVDNRIPRVDGTVGTNIQSSGIGIDDSDKVEGVAAITMKLGTVTNNVPTAINVTFPPWNVSGAGAADQTAAIQAVIDYVGDLSYRVPIFFPAGIYRVDGTVNVDHTLTLVGQNSPFTSAGTTILKNGTGAALNLSVQGVELRNFYVNCQDNAENRIGIALMGATDASFAILDNIRVFEASVGVWCNNAWSSTLRNVIATSCTDALIISNACSAISLENCEFSSSMNGIHFASGASAAKDTFVTGAQIQHNDMGVYGTNTYLQNPTFLSCHFEANTNYDVFLTDAMAPIVQGCIFTGLPTARTNVYFAGVTNWVWIGNSYWDDTIPFSCDAGSKVGIYTSTLDGGGFANDPVIGATDALRLDLITGTGSVVRSASPVLSGDPTSTTPGASDNDTSIATTAFVTGSTVAFTGKTFDAAGTGNVLKQTKHLFLMRPDYGDGAGAVPQTNNFTASGLMHYTFSGTDETNVNWVVYETIVPADIDTAVAMTATVAFVSGGTDADDVTFHLTYALGASGTALPTGTAIATSPIVVTKTPTSPASGDVQVSAATTLTAWAGSMTAGTPLLIRMARLNNDNDDSAREMYLDIAYGSTL